MLSSHGLDVARNAARLLGLYPLSTLRTTGEVAAGVSAAGRAASGPTCGLPVSDGRSEPRPISSRRGQSTDRLKAP